MNDIPNTEAYMALAGTVFGGAGLKFIEALVGRGKRKDDTATLLRTELRQEVSTLRVEMEKVKHEVDRLDDEVDKWRSRYFALLAAVATNNTEYINKVLQTRSE